VEGGQEMGHIQSVNSRVGFKGRSAFLLALNFPEGGQGVLGLDALSNDNPVLH
jgi:hypothetical protein